MAVPYHNVAYAVNKIRESYLQTNSDPRNIIKFYKANNSTAYNDDFPGLRARENSPPISFRQLDQQALNGIKSMKGDIGVEQEVEQDHISKRDPLSSTLDGTFQDKKSEEFSLQTVQLESEGELQSLAKDKQQDQQAQQPQRQQQQQYHFKINSQPQSRQASAAQQQDKKGISKKSPHNNRIKTNLNKIFRTATTNDGSVDDDSDDDDDDDDESDNTSITNSDNNDDDNDKNNDEYIYDDNLNDGIEGDQDIENGSARAVAASLAHQRDDMTRIDHDNLQAAETEPDGKDIERPIFDDAYDSDEGGHFLSGSDLTDSDAFLTDDSFLGSNGSSSVLRHANSSGSLAQQYVTSSRKNSQDLLKRPSITGLRQRTRTERFTGDARRGGANTSSGYIESEAAGDVKRNAKSASNLLSLAYSPTKQDDQRFNKKQQDLVKPILQSTLTAAIKKSENKSVAESVLSFFSFVGDIEEKRAITIKVFLPGEMFEENYQAFKIRRDALVKDFIGFILLRLKSKRKSSDFVEELENPNHWCLRMVEDDGVIDDDFGPLDRKKPISGFGVEEVSIEKVSEADFLTNQRLYPLPVVPGNKSSTSVVANKDGGSLSKEPAIPEDESMQDSGFAKAGITLPSKASNWLKDANLQDTQRERAYSIKDKKQTPESNNGKKTASSYRQKSLLSPSTANNNASKTSLTLRQQSPFPLSNNADGVTTSSFFKWTVWRHHQVSFKNRHERSLSIDGEYVYFIPDSTTEHDKVAYKYLVDANNAKTTSFHVSQIIKCKQSRKYPVNLKIVVMKTSGPKRYDLEALDVVQSEEIVKAINNLVNAYAMRKVV